MSFGRFAPKLFERLGAKVTKLFCLVDGNFPNHHPDPSKLANLEDIIQAVKDTNADMYSPVQYQLWLKCHDL
jgi:phosphomannomutase/phosphoglucomutase